MNRSRSLPSLIAGLALVLAACGGTTSSTTFSTVGGEASDEPTPTQSAAPSAAEPSEAATASEAAEPSEAAAEEALVRLSQFEFDPVELTIAAGTEVSFVNADSAAHTATEGANGEAADDPIIDEELQQNGSTSFAFEEAGTYEITCLFHPSMNMTITVE
ncbi:MAG: cupredoxin domain-containing protein [Chloroflexota bacterium]|nr:cupredoxin domain-containing protein [Chloroflexota bacterium]